MISKLHSSRKGTVIRFPTYTAIFSSHQAISRIGTGCTMNKASRIITVIVVLLMVMPGMVWGADKALRGIKGLLVVVEKINPEIEKDGLTENQNQTDVELKLRMAGLNVLTSEERKK